MKIKIRNLTKSYGKKIVLDNINLDMDNFNSLAVIGPSGGGKSTLLRILAGLIIPDSGEIYINDKKIEFNEDFLMEYRKSIGVVFQAYNLFPHLNALDNITLPLVKVHSLDKQQAENNASELLKKFQLSEHKFKKPHELSGGQQQRVAIARALALNAEFFLFDEPTSALDPEITSEVLNSIQDLEKQKKDIIIVTHEMGFARQACDSIVFLSEGKILEFGDSNQIFKTPKTNELKGFLEKILEWN